MDKLLSPGQDLGANLVLPDSSLWSPDRWKHKYSPLIKHGGFNPNPISGRIPAFADSTRNKDIIGTPLYDEFWQEQVDRCINGYITGKMYIPGRYYYFLNFQPLAGVTGGMYPYYCDFHLELSYSVEWVKFYKNFGLVILKARRKGLSEYMKGAIINYGVTFVDAYRGGVFAGIDNYVQGFKKKVLNGLNNTVDDMRMSVLKNNEKQIKIGYEEKLNGGSFIDSGCLSEIQFETMFNSDSKMEGEYFNDVLSEESGENPKLKGAVESIKPSLMFGANMEGTFYIYGTSGNILSGSRDFVDILNNAEAFDMIKIFVPGTRLYYPFFLTPKDEPFYDKNLKKEIDPLETLRPLIDAYGKDALMGCEDVDAAENNIRALFKMYENLDDKKNLLELKKNFPLTEEDAIISGGSNNFNNELLFSRLDEVEKNPKKPGLYCLDFETNENGSLKIPLKVKHRIPTKDDPEWSQIYISQFPLEGMKNVDAAGVDSYNQDRTNTSRSLGGMVVIRDGRNLPSDVNGVKIKKGLYPVCWYQNRPPKKELFYDISLKISVFYDLIRDTMISAEHDFLIDYYKKNFGRRYLAYRPRSFDSPSTEAVYEYGAKIQGFNVSRVVGIIQSYVEEHIHLCDSVILIRELIAFDEINIGSDWDIVDALGYALMRILDRKTKPKSSSDNLEEDDNITWSLDKDGDPIMKKTGNHDDDNDVIFFGDKKVHA